MNKFRELIKRSILFDSHCHLNESIYDKDRDMVIERAYNSGIEIIFDIATSYASTKKAIEYARKNHRVFASIGVDMETCVPGSDLYVENFEIVEKEIELFMSMSINGYENCAQMVGETGIDLYWMRVKEIDSKIILDSLEKQKWVFKKHIELANKFQLPLTIHSRDAIDECLKILVANLPSSEGEDVRIPGVFHSLTPDFNDDERTFYRKIHEIFDQNFMIGINGIVTFKNANLIRNTFIKVIKEKSGTQNSFDLSDVYGSGFVFETDGPFLAPEGKRGERNEPANVRIIHDFLLSVLNE